jgi:hypothetical protein
MDGARQKAKLLRARDGVKLRYPMVMIRLRPISSGENNHKLTLIHDVPHDEELPSSLYKAGWLSSIVLGCHYILDLDNKAFFIDPDFEIKE